MQPIGKDQFNVGVQPQQTHANHAVTSAIGQAGQAVSGLSKLALELQKEKQNQWLTEADIKLREASARLQVFLSKKKFAPEEHVAEAQRFYGEARAAIISDKRFDKGFRSNLDYRLRHAISGRIERVATDAQLQQVEIGKSLLIKRMKMDADERNYDGAREGVKQGVGTHWSKEEADIMLKQFDNDETHGLRMAEIQGDPSGAEEALKSGTGHFEMPSHDKPIYEQEIRRVKQLNRRDELEDLDNRIARGEISTPSDIDLMVQSGLIRHMDDATIAKIKKGMVRTKPVSPKEQARFYAALSEYDQAREGGMDKAKLSALHSELEQMARSLPAGAKRSNMLNSLTKRDPYAESKGGSSESNASINSIIRKSANRQIYTLMRSGRLGTYHNSPKENIDPFTGEQRSEVLTPELLSARTADNEAAELVADRIRIEIEEILASGGGKKEVEAFLTKKFGDQAALQAGGILSRGARPDRDSDTLLPEPMRNLAPPE